MKNGNKFLLSALNNALERQGNIRYSCVAIIFLILCSMGLALSFQFNFEKSYVVLPAIVITAIILFAFREYFSKHLFADKIMNGLIKRELARFKQISLELKSKPGFEWKKNDDLEEIELAINSGIDWREIYSNRHSLA